MKRRGNVFDLVVDMDNLRLAFYKAANHKSLSREVMAFRANLGENLLAIHRALIEGSFVFGDYRRFRVFDPKERWICAAPFAQRVVHHALMNVCHEDFERFQTNDSYASRLGRGTYKALDIASRNQNRYGFWLKLDVRKYFDSVVHERLKQMLSRMYKDKALLRTMFDIIDSYHTQPGKGLPIGNLTSQYFANHYLAYVDHLVKERLGVKAYVRYMDDMLLWSDTRDELKAVGRVVRRYLSDNLLLDLKMFQLHATGVYAGFLGYRIKRGRRIVTRRSAKRYNNLVIKAQKLYDYGIWGDEEIHRHFEAALAFLDKADTSNLRRRVMNGRQYSI